jgi:hypothetical protein
MYEFVEDFGCQFGDRKQAFKYYTGRTGRLHFRTGSISEKMLRFRFGGSIPGFGPKVDATLIGPDGVHLNYDSLYMSADGTDPLAGMQRGHENLGPRPPRENAALEPNTDYYLDWTLTTGSETTAVKLTYIGTDSPDDYVIIGDGGVTITLLPDGTWTTNS